jgi:hypothetical protein
LIVDSGASLTIISGATVNLGWSLDIAPTAFATVYVREATITLQNNANVTVEKLGYLFFTHSATDSGTILTQAAGSDGTLTVAGLFRVNVATGTTQIVTSTVSPNIKVLDLGVMDVKGFNVLVVNAAGSTATTPSVLVDAGAELDLSKSAIIVAQGTHQPEVA